MEFDFKLNEFEGPLDLLLHLIKKDNIDIYDINLESLTNQYLYYIKSMEKLNLDIASEYLVLAAELIELKSKSLLPKSEIAKEDDYEENTKENLIKKLIDYKKYKEITETFKELELKRTEIYTKNPENLKEFIDDFEYKLNAQNTKDDLTNAFLEFLKRKEQEKPLKTTITKKDLSIKDRTSEIREILKQKKKVYLEELFSNITKAHIVITFLSILEMAKKQEIQLKQNKNFEKIFITISGEKI